MSKAEILVTGIGEMRDMIACMAIYEGGEKQKAKASQMGFEEVMSLR